MIETFVALPVSEPLTGRAAARLGLLAGRTARCCDAAPVLPSSESLAFFTYRGAGSDEENLCECTRHHCAHRVYGVEDNVDPRTVIQTGWCAEFRSRGPAEQDLYYCGHGGWD